MRIQSPPVTPTANAQNRSGGPDLEDMSRVRDISLQALRREVEIMG